MKKNKLLLIALLFGSVKSLYAQQASTTAGGNATGSGGTVNYTIGQTVYTTASGTTGTVAQGVQQTYVVTEVPSAIKDTDLTVSFSVFPNPATNNVTIQVSDFVSSKLTYQLRDLHGSLIDEKEITSTQTQLNMVSLPVAVYFVNITTESKSVKQFKIIKN